MNLTERVKGILLKPTQEWQTIAGETTSIPELYQRYVVILAAIGPIASVIGMSFVGFRGFRISLSTSLASGIVQFVLSLVSVYVLARVIDGLASTFSGEKNVTQAFKVAAYSSTPGWVLGVLWLIPALSPLMILALYGLYLLFIGLPMLMKVPQEKSLGYTVTVVVIGLVIFIVIGQISRAFISYPTIGMP
jgi:hypothetical protein